MSSKNYVTMIMTSFILSVLMFLRFTWVTHSLLIASSRITCIFQNPMPENYETPN
ncbi:Protein CBG27871 [Caenorhabditis briggsae]|uniref:Protein CBG27871 n=1 Tax=Caenorhabditis briggsae TaxID=6238 RepID=B6IEG6_CAEBR|nr:Protein CBG27871 [Caenorhabditis briggsae]CAR98296.1 Protein CBG27871 [Caenorhabditis briggsae]